METYLKHYQMALKTLSPVFIGDGGKLIKKEYVFQKSRGKVLVMNQGLMYRELQRRGQGKAFEQYLLSDERRSAYLGSWFSERRLDRNVYEKWVKYTLDCGDFLQERGAITIVTCQKDAQGKPYIPGTSLKGMLRTILLADILSGRREEYHAERRKVVSEASIGVGRKKYLREAASNIEVKAFHTLDRKEANGKNIPSRHAVNDCLSGLVVSDSAPMSADDLVLCQKRDRNVRGEEHAINILRESFRPGTSISFSITIDTQICPYSIEDIMGAVDRFGEMYYEVFLSKFPHMDRPDKNTVWLGGGSGYLSKTILYPLLGEKEGVDATIQVMRHTLSEKIFREHKHNNDKKNGISPHILKMTQYKGVMYQMGMCRLEVMR